MPTKRILITGGAGFVGCNAARFFRARNWGVTVLDNLSRQGTDKNLEWLRDEHQLRLRAGRHPRPRERGPRAFRAELRRRAASGGTGGRHDLGHRPEHRLRHQRHGHVPCARRHPALLPRGRLHQRLDQQGLRQDRRAEYELRDGRYAYINRPFGIGESEPLDFLSPYGCSKGAADQYALDFARIYQIPATSFRQSCIYGPRQFGVEDQGWVAWFAIASLLGRDITIFGDGRQVRDVLHVEDLVRAYEAAIRCARQGGGPGLQCRRRPGLAPVAARPRQDAGGAPEAQHSSALGRLAAGRPARLRQRHPQARDGSGLEARDRRRRPGIAHLIDWVAQNRAAF